VVLLVPAHGGGVYCLSPLGGAGPCRVLTGRGAPREGLSARPAAAGPTGGLLSRRAAALAALAAALVAAVALAWGRLRAAPQTDEERIVALLEDAARAAEERRVADAVAPVSERFAAGGLDRRGVKQLVALQVLRGEWVSVSVTTPRVRLDGDRARANVDAVLSRGAKGKALAALVPGEASVHRFALRLEREPEGWRVVEASWRPVDLAEAIAGPPEPEP
jgi:hypothetical protein